MRKGFPLAYINVWGGVLLLFKEIKLKSRFVKNNKVFFTQQQQVIAYFLDAVMENPNDAWAFVSKVYSPQLDLEKLREVLNSGAKIQVEQAMYLNDAKNIISIYVKNVAILHLKMVKDNGWKIYNVEQEECVK